MPIPKMLEDITTEDEKSFFQEYGRKLNTSSINQKDISLAFHRIGNMREMVNSMIASNKALSESTDRHSKWMRGLTFALVGVAIAQVVVAFLGLQ